MEIDVFCDLLGSFEPGQGEPEGLVISFKNQSKTGTGSFALGLLEEESIIFRLRSIAFVAGLALCIPGLGNAQLTIEDRLAPGQPPVIVAHRAHGGGFPENSLASIEYAIESGVEMLEVDVQMTFDGQHVLLHDPSLDRTTNVKDVFPDGSPHRKHIWNLALDYTLEDIKELHLTDGIAGGEHKVPSLVEALDLIDTRAMAILELKTYDLEKLKALFQAHGMENILIFHKDVGKLQDAVVATGARAFAIMDDARDYEVTLDDLLATVGPNLAMVRVKGERLTPAFIQKAEDAGVRLCVNGMGFEDTSLTGGDASKWQEALRSGAVAFMTDHPEAVLDLLGR